MTRGRVPGESLRPSSPMLVSTSQPPPSPQPSLPITWRTKLLDVVSEDVLPSDLLNRPFLLLYLPWRSQEGTRVESESTFPNPHPIRPRATAKPREYHSLIRRAPPFFPRWYSPRGREGPDHSPGVGDSVQERWEAHTETPKPNRRGWEGGGTDKLEAHLAAKLIKMLGRLQRPRGKGEAACSAGGASRRREPGKAPRPLPLSWSRAGLRVLWPQSREEEERNGHRTQGGFSSCPTLAFIFHFSLSAEGSGSSQLLETQNEISGSGGGCGTAFGK